MSFQNNKIYTEVIDLIKLSKFNEAKNILLSVNENYLKDASFYNLFGFIYDSISEVDNAQKNYLKSLEIDKNFYEAKYNLAILFYKIKKYNLAEELFSELIRVNRGDYNSYYNLGIIKFDQKQYKESIPYFIEACKINKNFYPAYHHLAVSYEEIKNFDDAIFFYNKAIEINKDQFLFSHNNLGNVYLNLKNYGKALDYFNQALKLKGNKALVYNNLGVVNFEIGNVKEAASFFERAIELDDKNAKYCSTLLGIIPFLKKKISYYNKYAKKFRTSIELLSSDLIDKSRFENNPRDLKLKIGFLSSDFKQHPTGYYLLDLVTDFFEKNIFELYAFSDSNYVDQYTKALKKNFHCWQDVSLLTDLQLVNLIKNHGINILVDMQGHTYGNRLQIFANKPAPIQISWASYLASTGIPEIDYIIADPYVVPENEDKNYIEKIWRLPNIWNALSTSDIKHIDTDETPAIKNGFITFGCFSNVKKINDEVISVWSKIINSVKGSKLFLKSDKFLIKGFKKEFFDKFKFHGVDQSKLIFEKQSSRDELLKSYNKVDIALDTFPYSGGTTSIELSWMCVPLLTLVGDRFISRCGESVNNNLGMTEWIATNEEEYINKAIRFSGDIKELQLIRNELRANSRKSNLFNIDLFSNNFKDALYKIWQIYLNRN